MGTDKSSFVVVLCGGATGSHMTGRGHVWKYVLRMHNWKLCNWDLLTGSVRKGRQIDVTGSGPGVLSRTSASIVF